MLAPWKKSYDQPRQHIKKQRHYYTDQGRSSQSYGFSVVIYGCGIWTINKAEHWQIDAFELGCWRRLLRVPWTTRRFHQSILIYPDHPGDQSWVFIGRTDVEAETLVLWPPHEKSWLIWKDPDVGKDWRQKEKAMMEDELVGWHHRLDGHEFE